MALNFAGWARRQRAGYRLCLIVLAALSGCGGNARKDAPSVGNAAGASMSAAGSSSGAPESIAGASGGGSAASGGGSAASGGGSAASGGGSAASGGGSASAACYWDGQADWSSTHLFDGYAFDPEAGHCRYLKRINSSRTVRFDTLEACSATCDPPSIGQCRVADDCMVERSGCCLCEPVSLVELRAIGRNYADARCESRACSCVPFDGDPQRPYYGARCVNERCQLFDVRETDLLSCESDADCSVRLGLSCCQCGSADVPVAVAVNRQKFAAMSAELLDCAPGQCPQCDERPKWPLAACVEGRCRTLR